ncbi:MAG: GNAT family N-acetyltransferase [Colwellia sp.]
MPNKPSISYELLTSQYFDQVISLANKVHGDGYLCSKSMASWAERGIKNDINSSYIALDGDKVVGFRITFSAGQWKIDQWSTPELWQVPRDLCCYFKCNTIDEDYRGQGIGKHLLNLSIDAVKKQGAIAGTAHLWQQSPNNSAVAYFSKCGGQLVKLHPDKWHEDSKQGYDCILCGNDCHCEAAEMIIHFT